MRQNYQISEQFPSREKEEALGFPLFALKKYWLLHVEEEKILPVSVYNDHNEIVAFWCFVSRDGKLSTPFKAPFFTPYISNDENKVTVLSKIISYCKLHYQFPIEFTLWPNSILLKLQNSVSDFRIKNVELGTRIKVSAKDFTSKIRRVRKKQKLKSLFKDKTYEVLKVADGDWEEVYEQNIKWRREKAHLSYMSLEDMMKAKTQFPECYHAFQLQNDGELVGTCFFLTIDVDLIYVYSLITAPAIDADEPSLLLWNELYNWAKSKNISTLDMGTSMFPKGGINKRLAWYKYYLGGLHYRKYTIEC